jgi:hypothetical protein
MGMSTLFDDSELDSEVIQDTVHDPDNLPHARIPVAIIQQYGKQLGACGIAVYVGIRCHANRSRGHSTFILVKTLSDELGMGESTVRRELLSCEQMGLISRKHRKGRSTVYVVTPVFSLIEGGLLLDSGGSSIREKYNQKNLTRRTEPSSADDGEDLKPSKKKRRTRDEIFEPYSEETKEIVNEIIDIWPKVRPANKSKIEPDLPLLASRIDQIRKTSEHLTKGIILGTARRYVDEQKEFPHAPEFFFGPGKNGEPPWRAYARMEYHEQQKQLTAVTR